MKNEEAVSESWACNDISYFNYVHMHKHKNVIGPIIITLPLKWNAYCDIFEPVWLNRNGMKYFVSFKNTARFTIYGYRAPWFMF